MYGQNIMADWHEISGGVTAPKGYRATGIKAGLKPSGLPDLALILSDVDAIAAGVFTTSQVRAACVDYCRQLLQAKPSARAILCNAGQANAATGSQGWLNALRKCHAFRSSFWYSFRVGFNRVYGGNWSTNQNGGNAIGYSSTGGGGF